MIPLNDCPHDAQLLAECEGYENPTEPLSIRVTCPLCNGHLTVIVEDVALLQWEED